MTDLYRYERMLQDERRLLAPEVGRRMETEPRPLRYVIEAGGNQSAGA
ncbi:hypothetical protein [Sphingobium sp.]|nr:hypothetical protein [Sphingobium sp.]HUD95815.1 hypothetical protein [Sphingobium sp.]